MSADYKEHWDEKFRSRQWGRYPPEDLVRFTGRNYFSRERSEISFLEVGCGTGANLWFLHREGFMVSGIDGSSHGVDVARKRLSTENHGLNASQPDLRVGDFSVLPWPDNSFDVVIDVFAVYANTIDVIEATLAEVRRVLKPGGRFYSKLWGTGCDGFGQGVELERHTFDEIPCGPCKDMGVSHFFSLDEIRDVFSAFRIDAIERVCREDLTGNLANIEEFHCQFTKTETEE